MLEDKCSVSSCGYLKNIEKLFSSTQDLKVFKVQEIFQHLLNLSYEDCEEHQEQLLKHTIESPLINKYPVRRSYQLAFLKYCIAQAEKLSLEFSIGYELYVKLLNENKVSEINSYKHYFIGERILTLKENNNFISGGTTGLCTWQAAIALANWCLCYNHITSSKNVIELGCGSGLTGIALLNSSSYPKEYIFTDCHPLVLRQLEENLDINIPGKGFPRNFQNSFVDVSEFDWRDEVKDFTGADVILGADIVYDIDLIELLCNVLQKLLNNQEKRAVIACTVRNQETIDIFIRSIESRNLVITEDKADYPCVIEGSSISPVNIYIIRK